jgi:hypothetical protein
MPCRCVARLLVPAGAGRSLGHLHRSLRRVQPSLSPGGPRLLSGLVLGRCGLYRLLLRPWRGLFPGQRLQSAPGGALLSARPHCLRKSVLCARHQLVCAKRRVRLSRRHHALRQYLLPARASLLRWPLLPAGLLPERSLPGCSSGRPVWRSNLRAARQLLRRTMLHGHVHKQPVLSAEAGLRTDMLRARAKLHRSDQGCLRDARVRVSGGRSSAMSHAASQWYIYTTLLQNPELLRRPMLSAGPGMLLQE